MVTKCTIHAILVAESGGDFQLDNAISKNFDAPKLIKFALPTIVMMVVLSLYTTVDGAFVAKLVSEDALASINIVYPFTAFISP